jgi:hypothetical protein
MGQPMTRPAPDRNEKPPWPAHDDDGVWYCDAHGSYQCRKCSDPMTQPRAIREAKPE